MKNKILAMLLVTFVLLNTFSAISHAADIVTHVQKIWINNTITAINWNKEEEPDALRVTINTRIRTENKIVPDFTTHFIRLRIKQDLKMKYVTETEAAYKDYVDKKFLILLGIPKKDNPSKTETFILNKEKGSEVECTEENGSYIIDIKSISDKIKNKLAQLTEDELKRAELFLTYSSDLPIHEIPSQGDKTFATDTGGNNLIEFVDKSTNTAAAIPTQYLPDKNSYNQNFGFVAFDKNKIKIQRDNHDKSLYTVEYEWDYYNSEVDVVGKTLTINRKIPDGAKQHQSVIIKIPISNHFQLAKYNELADNANGTQIEGINITKDLYTTIPGVHVEMTSLNGAAYSAGQTYYDRASNILFIVFKTADSNNYVGNVKVKMELRKVGSWAAQETLFHKGEGNNNGIFSLSSKYDNGLQFIMNQSSPYSANDHSTVKKTEFSSPKLSTYPYKAQHLFQNDNGNEEDTNEITPTIYHGPKDIKTEYDGTHMEVQQVIKEGYTLKEIKNITITEEEANNIVKILYTKNKVKLIANSAKIKADGTEKEVEGFTSEPHISGIKNLDDSEIAAVGKGTAVGIYDVNFSTTNAKVKDADGKVYFAEYQKGKLEITDKETAKYTVRHILDNGTVLRSEEKNGEVGTTPDVKAIAHDTVDALAKEGYQLMRAEDAAITADGKAVSKLVYQKNRIKLTAKSETATYSAVEIVVTGFATEPEGKQVTNLDGSEIRAIGKGKDVGVYEVEFLTTHEKVKDADGKVYFAEYEKGKLEITAKAAVKYTVQHVLNDGTLLRSEEKKGEVDTTPNVKEIVRNTVDVLAKEGYRLIRAEDAAITADGKAVSKLVYQKNRIKLTAKSETATYSAVEIVVTGFATEPEGKQVTNLDGSEIRAIGKGKDVGVYEVEFLTTHEKVKDADGKVYFAEYEKGKLEITASQSSPSFSGNDYILTPLKQNPKLPMHRSYMFGYPDNTIRPESNITREEAAVILHRLLEGQLPSATGKVPADRLSDVTKDSWAKKEIISLFHSGVITGTPDGTFRPKDNITRAEVAAMIARFKGFPFAGIQSPLKDINGHWAASYISGAYDKGFVAGYPDNTFKPDSPITRAEYIVILNNLMDRRVKPKDVLSGYKTYQDANAPSKWYYYPLIAACNTYTYEEYKEDGKIYQKWIALYNEEK